MLSNSLVHELKTELSISLPIQNVSVTRLALDVLPQELLSYFQTRGLEVLQAFQFSYHKVFQYSLPHIDVNVVDSRLVVQEVALNLQLQGKSVVKFYPEAEGRKLSYVGNGIPYVSYETPNACSFEYSPCSKPFLIRTDVPHAVEVTEAPRSLVTFRFFKNKKPLSWGQAINEIDW